jgi:hypothetical protein
MSGAQIHVSRQDGSSLYDGTCVDLATVAGWPTQAMTLALVPGNDNRVPFRVAVDGFEKCGDPKSLVSDSAQVEFVDHEHVVLELALSSVCIGVSCQSGYTCDPQSGMCVPEQRGVLPKTDDLGNSPSDLSSFNFPDGFSFSLDGGGSSNEFTIVSTSASAPQLVPAGSGFDLIDYEGTTLMFRHIDLSGSTVSIGGAVAIASGVDTTGAPAFATNGAVDLVAYRSPGSMLHPQIVMANTGAPSGGITSLGGIGPVMAATYEAGASQFRLAYGATNFKVAVVNTGGAITDQSIGMSTAAVSSVGIAGSPSTLAVWHAADLAANTLNNAFFAPSLTTGTFNNIDEPFALVGRSSDFMLLGQAAGKMTAIIINPSMTTTTVGSNVALATGNQIVLTPDGNYAAISDGTTMTLVAFYPNMAGHVVVDVPLVPADGNKRWQPSIALNTATSQVLLVYVWSDGTSQLIKGYQIQ